PFLELFDGADPNATTGERTAASVPAQALYLMNHPFVAQQAKALAKRVLQANDHSTVRTNELYRLALARLPTAEESQRVEQFVAKIAGLQDSKASDDDLSTWTALAKVLLTSNEFFF